MIDEIAPNARNVNRVRLLQALLHGPGRNRAELGRALGLSRATITAVLLDLERAGMVEQQADGPGEGPRSNGRPPLQVSLAPSAAYAVGLDFGHRHVRAAVCDLGGRIVADKFTAFEVDAQPLESFGLAAELTHAALGESGVDARHVIGVGAGLPAPINTETGLLHADGILPSWRGLKPAVELEARLGMPVNLENDANAGAMGEHLFGAGRGVRNMAYLQISAGVGLGLILNGEPYRGVTGVAGELGHLTVVEDGLICRCGNRGCLETIANSVAVTGLLTRSLGQPVTLQRLLALVEAGDRGARRAVADAGEAVGIALAAVINVLNPELVVIGGELSATGDVLLEPIRAAVERRVIAPAASAVRVVTSELGERAEVTGAAALQLARAPVALAERLAGRA
ncbi:ROK family transcriptional regulator [Solirubrobacter ginsenosidimutans]|uniref:ROK family transcriptional regulator n=1 Tax=Solirubrobacter ginsenosidimutans TaxID=490573 RepID=A0A9X3S614_9ACTN|nr:ROK family transcriptional regulator [Solirubrobacter ginsenosidimutans]MDA0167339.1 ROK family transcriptional regulator [Solirubrobacter ginsenosidimutans]